MGQSELRQIARSGSTVSMKTTLSSVSKSLHAKVVEARAFDADGVYYRLVLKRSNGKLVSVIIDAQIGRNTRITFRGTVNSTYNSMSGQFEYRGSPAGAWSATKFE